jgi:hypothetical protein
MQQDIGRVYMVHWQGRRIAPEQRAKGRLMRLALAFAVLAALSLMGGFYSGLPIPIALLQTVFATVANLLALFGAWLAWNALLHRGERARISGYRR